MILIFLKKGHSISKPDIYKLKSYYDNLSGNS